jgi:D-alanine---D-serine ligase
LSSAIELAFEHDDKVLIEENIPGFEVGCSVLGNSDLIVGAVDEIELRSDAPQNSFFDYDEKYLRTTARIHVPARISEQKAEEIRETAKKIYRALDCTGFARVDMFLTPGGEIVFNEVNTIPGLTGSSRYLSMLEAIGMTFEQFVSAAIDLAVKA